MTESAGRTVLIVEDDHDLQEIYSVILRSRGCQVEVARDGVEGLAALERITPDLILLDYFMPRLDGRGFLQRYEADRFPHTTVVVASNVSDRQVLDELVALGAERTVLKADLSPAQLLALVEELFEA